MGARMDPLRALVLVCTLKKTPSASSSHQIAKQVMDALREEGVEGEVIRVVDHDVKFGVTPDEGDGDAWPGIRGKLMASDILVLATPIWLGQPSSVCKMVLERLDAEISETDDDGRMLTYGKVAAVAVVGNEDGAHHVVAETFQALNDVGFTLAANANTYWVGEAMEGTDYQDLQPSPEQTVSTNRSVARNTAHLARLLKGSPYPAQG
jgi:multimeric flavodoxin WrbA